MPRTFYNPDFHRSPFSRLLRHGRGCWKPILTRILTGLRVTASVKQVNIYIAQSFKIECQNIVFHFFDHLNVRADRNTCAYTYLFIAKVVQNVTKTSYLKIYQDMPWPKWYKRTCHDWVCICTHAKVTSMHVSCVCTSIHLPHRTFVEV
jgi:hypothetical protein